VTQNIRDGHSDRHSDGVLPGGVIYRRVAERDTSRTQVEVYSTTLTVERTVPYRSIHMTLMMKPLSRGIQPRLSVQ
jgi:hypothetical protein